MSLLCMRQTFRIWSTIHKTRKLAVLLAKLVPKEPKCSSSAKMSVSADKMKAIALEIKLDLYICCLFCIDKKFNWYWEACVQYCLTLGCIKHTCKVYGLSHFRPDASRVTLLESRRKRVAWWTYMITSWHGIAFLINPIYDDDPPVSGRFPKQNTSNGKIILLFARTIGPTVHMSVIWNVTMPMWRHCDIADLHLTHR